MEFQISPAYFKRWSLYSGDSKNAQIPVPDSISYQLNVVHNYPQINVQQFSDSSDAAIVYLAGDVSDDYGLRNLQFDYIIRHKDGREEPKQSKLINNFTGKTSTFRHQFDMNELNIEPGVMSVIILKSGTMMQSMVVNPQRVLFKITDWLVLTNQQVMKKNSEEIKANLQKSIDDREIKTKVGGIQR